MRWLKRAVRVGGLVDKAVLAFVGFLFAVGLYDRAERWMKRIEHDLKRIEEKAEHPKLLFSFDPATDRYNVDFNFLDDLTDEERARRDQMHDWAMALPLVRFGGAQVYDISKP